jgi:co-chaperonin GroES (HSP10)
MKATNDFVLVIRDETPAEKNGLIMPSSGRVKPHTGTITTAGALTKDQNIKAGKGKKVLFHPTVGFELEYEGQIYLVLTANQIIAMP